ncbi:MAG: 3-keto-5-aminohexanoate cleavage protein [Gammaproteobacteria bacterium]|nr:3-keto-5-aminohexanoate cleavage protein [Gammaproteobacteria bacterium]NIR81877.1 3-keto-5-aminohexanoate cleavage protein [Gammaproteobacteria bacterium]NIR88709.1 3-keto-5-aminohexanoate cleavage protein [Gammaproteobacteria bacterium]NIU02985.1 3-keto-5-aminohexanoate cleavage protein [Gammaproteobacteria bacterium]NIV50506.1 3-keto-5-aminohexanoate cleavage protein [Gammaproteobacteria bacterium]
MVAPNGAYKSKADHPAIPLSPPELARTAAECERAGAAMIHLHVRDAGGRHTLDPAAYREAIEAVRDAVDERLVVQVTSEAAGVYAPAEQMRVVRELEPESVSLAVREIVPDEGAEPEATEFLHWVIARGILPQFILYSAQDVLRYHELRARGVIPPGEHFVLFVLGRYRSDRRSEPRDLLAFVETHQEQSPWAVCAFGAREHACGVAAAALGGHVRVGFENNLYLKDGERARSNAELVAQICSAAEALGRPCADAQGARALLGAGGR